MKNIPKEIYLNLGIPKRVFDITRDDIDFKQLNGVSWSTDKIDDQDLKFVLSDVSQKRELLKKWWKYFDEESIATNCNDEEREEVINNFFNCS